MRYSLLLCMLFAGCQCMALTEPYQNRIDRIADREGQWDRLYSPAYDLTRIGRSDWCSYPVNQWLCPCRCNQRGAVPYSAPYSSAPYGMATEEYVSEPQPAEQFVPNAPVPLPEPAVGRQPYSREASANRKAAMQAVPPQPESSSPESSSIRVAAPRSEQTAAFEFPVPLQDSTSPPVLPITAEPVVGAAQVEQQSFEWAAGLQAWKDERAATPQVDSTPLQRNRAGAIIAPRPAGPARPVWARGSEE